MAGDSTRRAALREIAPALAVWAAGAVLSAWFTLKVTEWTVMTDELQHVKLAASIADTLDPRPRIHGEAVGAYAVLYPLLIAPLVGVFDMPTAFKAIHLVNSVVMASAAVPAYLLARAVVRWRPAAVLVAALTVAVPWMAMGLFVMTETVAYPAFLWALLAIYGTLVAPSPKRDVLALVALAVAFLARTQFIVLVLVVPVAVLAHEVGFALLSGGGERRRTRALRALRGCASGHRVLLVVTALGAAVLLAAIVSGHSKLLLGGYGVTTRGNLLPPGLGSFAAQLAGISVVAVGVVPLVMGAGWAVSSLIRPSDRRGHAFAVLLVATTTLLTVQVSSFLVRFAGTADDRYIFYLVPLFLVATTAAILDVRRRRVAVGLAGIAFAWVTTQVQFKPDVRAPFRSPPSVFDRVIEGRTLELDQTLGLSLTPRTVVLVVTLLVAAVAVAVLLLRRPRPRVALVVVSLAVLVFCTAETAYVSGQTADPISGNSDAGRDWVDSALPAGSHAGSVPGTVNQAPDGRPRRVDNYADIVRWWSVEFWNKSLTREYRYRGTKATSTPFPKSALTVDPTTGLVTAERLDTPYVVVSSSDVWLRLRGRTLARDVFAGLELRRASSPVRADWIAPRLIATGWMSAGLRYPLRLFGGPGYAGRTRSVSVTFTSIAAVRVSRPARIVSGRSVLARGVVPPGGRRTVTARVCLGSGPRVDLALVVGSGRPFAGGDKLPGGLRAVHIAAGPPGPRCSR